VKLFKWILFSLLSFNLLALEVSLSSAKENFEQYSTLHLKDDKEFLCQEIKDDFDVVTQIVCAFNKKPSSKVKELQNSFFKIKNTTKNKTFFLIITPFEKIKQYPIVFNMTKDSTVYEANAKMSSHWMIVGYKDKLPFIKEEKQTYTSINFPFELSADMLPFVGGLDIDGKPVHIKRVGDVTDYLKIKKYFIDKKYEKCLNLINEVMQKYPNSLFNAELHYYKIKVYNKLNDFDNVVEASKVYLREYSSDENVAEVLALDARAQSKIGLNSDADYFFDRLFSEHGASEFSKWGYIYKAEMLEESGGISKALNFYNKALIETKDIEIAATAAYKLALFKIGNSDKKEASKYIMKIVKAKPNLFMQDLKTSMEMMYSFAEEGDYATAAAIAKTIIDETDKGHDEYEKLLKDMGKWLSKTDKKQKALLALNRYIKEYQYGTYESEVQVAKDALFFDTTDDNLTTRLVKYDKLIEEYSSDTIGNRAIYEKAKLLLKNKMYRDVLDLKSSILLLDSEIYGDKEDIIKDAAVGVMKLALQSKECKEVIKISSEHNITLSSEWDDGIYECSMKGGDFALSKKLANRNLKSKDLNERKKWLYRYIKVDFATGNYSDVIDASKDLIALIEDDKNSKYKEVYRYLFDTYQRVENKEGMIQYIVILQKVFGLDYRDIERYMALVTIGNDTRDDRMVIKYGLEVVKIQKNSSSYVQSPYVEFALYQAFINIESYNEALDIIKSLDSVELKNSKRSRQKYLLGTVLSKLWRDEEAQKAFQEAIDADSSSAWAKLAQSAKDI